MMDWRSVSAETRLDSWRFDRYWTFPSAMANRPDLRGFWSEHFSVPSQLMGAVTLKIDSHGLSETEIE
jgi:hypothetical protein